MERLTRRPIVLVGLPGSGKTTVGALLAQRLATTFVDFDHEVAARAGKSVARLFEEDGEERFRAMETLVGAELLAGPPQVLAPGGGFFQDPANRRLALKKGFVVYLETSPAAAARRLAGQEERPLLKGFQPMLRLRQLLEQREAGYLEASGRLTTDERNPAEVADAVAELARGQGGW